METLTGEINGLVLTREVITGSPALHRRFKIITPAMLDGDYCYYMIRFIHDGFDRCVRYQVTDRVMCQKDEEYTFDVRGIPLPDDDKVV